MKIYEAITLLSVKIVFNYSLEIQKNSNKHAEKIHKDALENARKMQILSHHMSEIP